MFKVNNRDTRMMSGVTIVNFKHILHLSGVYIVNFEHVDTDRDK